MELTSLAAYAQSLASAVLDKDDPISKPVVRNRYALVRTSGWLKGSDRTMFISIFIYEEMDSIRVNVRSNRKGCFHYAPFLKTQITPEKVAQLAEKIITNVNTHIESCTQQ